MPVRKIPKSYRSVTGKFASLKNGRSISFESTLERDLFLSLEFDSQVSIYEEQPLVITGEVDGQRTKYTPDCLTTHTDGTQVIIEVKYQADLEKADDDLSRRLRLAETYAEQHKVEFRVVTELDLRGTKLDNQKFIYRFSSPPKDLVKMTSSVKSALKQPMPLNELLSTLSTDRLKQAAFSPAIWHLVFTGELGIDVNAPITGNTLIGANNHGTTIP